MPESKSKSKSGILRVGNGAGFLGDNLDAPVELTRGAAAAGTPLDVLTLEYLAELTMGILAHVRSRNPDAGHVADFPELVARLAALARSEGLAIPTIVTNAGGLNPPAAARETARRLRDAGPEFADRPLAVVAGDDIAPRLAELAADGVVFEHAETGEPLDLPNRTAAEGQAWLLAANAYLGAWPIAQALDGGASIVLAGRVADASLLVGPAAARHRWRTDDWDVLARATTLGHLIECGAQATGGLWHEWAAANLDDIGQPFAEVEADGSGVVSKPAGSGGLVTPANLAEQLMYEIDDPTRYRTPDVDADFAAARLEAAGPDRVRVWGATGTPPNDRLKVSIVGRDGWTASGMLAYVGRDAEAKARAAGRIVLRRLERAGFVPDASLVECLGAGDVVPGVWRPAEPPWEVVMRVTVRDRRRAAVERFCREIAPLVVSGPPGVAGYASGRPTPRPAFRYFPTFVPRDRVRPEVEIRPARDWAPRAGDDR